MNQVATDTFAFSFGFAAYSLIELAYRRYTHYTMGIAGGLCFLILYRLYKGHPYFSLLKKCVLGSIIITAVELLFGIVLNRFLKLGIWDYSNMPLNILGQVCPLFSFYWLLLCIPVSYLAKRLSRLEIAI
jgi:uncharacterized membrane protein